MKIKIVNMSKWRTKELRKLVTCVKRKWFDRNDLTYTIKFKDCGTRWTGCHGWAWYHTRHCEVYIPRDGRVDVWMARVIRHELLHLVENCGGRAWEIEQRRMDRKWSICPELRKTVPWIETIKLIPKKKKPSTAAV